eukprot:gb/GFBE01052206.1/.p1 GENE.gb/GFBE01052206.1/~~gb/GFBE01052206.1/.p1  ORF type:complete len:271 (+),score=62.92 gb/GFBE01052206.1/:1-813(+)
MRSSSALRAAAGTRQRKPRFSAGARNGGASKLARFSGHFTAASEPLDEGEENADIPEPDNFFFDWSALERAEARQRTRSLPVKLRRAERPRRELPTLPQMSRDVHQDEARVSAAGDDSSAASESQANSEAEDADSDRGSEKDAQRQQDPSCDAEVASSFKAWLDQRPAMRRLSVAGTSRPSEPTPSCGVAWDFPLAKCEKRELLLQHMAAGERMAELQAARAELEARLAREERERSQQSLDGAKAAIARMKRRKSRRSSARREPAWAAGA